MMTRQVQLDRYLDGMGIGTRSRLKGAAKEGRILVSGEVEKKAERKIVSGNGVISSDGQPVSYVGMGYYMLNKPQSVVLATEDKRHRTMVKLVGDRRRDDLFPVGRPDIGTEGLLLITNDRGLAHQLLSPKRHMDRVYFARIEEELPADAGERLTRGITLAGSTPTPPARLEIQKQDGGESEILLTIHEGKFHRVKRVFETLGCQVVYLKQVSMRPLVLDGGLQPGEHRALNEEELETLKNAQMTESAETKKQGNGKERHHIK